MPRNGAGIFSLVNNTWFPPVNGVLATATDWTTFISDIASAMTQSVSSDGQTPMTGNLPMGNNKITGLANGSAATDAATFGQLTTAVAQNVSQWTVFSGTPTFVNATTFTVTGDQTSIFQPQRRVRSTITAGALIYGTVLTSVFGAVTTVTLLNDSGALDAGLTSVSYGIISPGQTSLPPSLTGFRHMNIYKRIAGVQNVSVDGGAFTTTGAGTFTVPASGTFKPRVWGAGGGSGGTGGNPSASGGGGGGGYAECISSTTPGSAVTITVGAGGTVGLGSGTSPTNGGTGGTSSAGAFASATGGSGGIAALNGVTNSSTSGGTGTTVGGGYTSSGQNSSAGFLASSPYQAIGGGSPLGGMPTHFATSGVSAAGGSGNFPGGGASGSLNQANGGVGADGQVIIEY